MLKTKILTAVVAGALALPGAVMAEEAASPHTFTGNIGLFSDYSLRGLTQTMEEPAVQGGFDYAHSSGLYLGTWASNVSGSIFPGGSMEWDFYGGWAKTYGDWGVNVGAYYYYYPGAEYSNGDKFDFVELMIGGSWKWISLKALYAVNDFLGQNQESFGAFFSDGSDGSLYLDLTATYPVTDALSIVGHVGHQTIEGTAPGIDLDYTDYKIGVNYVYNGFNFGAYYKDTDASKPEYTFFTPNGKEVFLGDSAFIVSVSKTF